MKWRLITIKNLVLELIKGKWAHFLSLFFFLGIIVVSVMGGVKQDNTIAAIHIPIYSDIFEQCFYVKNFGVECPTCGMTRSFYAFFNGRFALGIRYNYLVVPSALLMLEIILYDLLYIVKSKECRLLVNSILVTVIVLVLMFLIRSYQMITTLMG